MSKRKQKRKQARSVEVRLRFLGAHIEGFRSWLRRNGYRSTTIVELVRLFACWTEWLPAAGFALDLDNILIGFDASAPAFKGDRTRRAPRGRAAHSLSSGTRDVAVASEAAISDGDMADTRSIPDLDAKPARRHRVHAGYLLDHACRPSQVAWRRSKSLYGSRGAGFRS
jgi:hypothetical protein